MDTTLVIDIGTSSLRALLMGPDGHILQSQVKKRTLPAVFDAEAEWACLREMLHALAASRPAVRAVAVSALLGWVGVDIEGRALTPCLTYMHQCPAEFQRFSALHMEDEVYALCARRPNPELAAFQLLHLRDTGPEVWPRLAHLLSLKDFVNRKLTGCSAMDRTTAAYTMLCDVRAGAWSAPLLSALGLDGEKLPPLCSPWEALGPLEEATARSLGLPPGIPVAVGSVDGSTGILGAGGAVPGSLVTVMGTTDTSFLVTPSFISDTTRSLVAHPHVIPGLWLLGGPMGMYGGAVDWFINELLAGGRTVDELTALAEGLPPGSSGVRFFPTLAGERAPFWEPGMRGTVLGMERAHGAEHLFRAILESNAYALRRIAELARQSGAELRQAVAIGGGARNDLWLQIKAQVLGIPLVRTAVPEATAAGSRILALMAAGVPLSQLPAAPVERVFSGGGPCAAAYQELYENYLSLHERVVQLY